MPKHKQGLGQVIVGDFTDQKLIEKIAKEAQIGVDDISGAAGAYVRGNGNIYLDEVQAKPETLFHEIGHNVWRKVIPPKVQEKFSSSLPLPIEVDRELSGNEVHNVVEQFGGVYRVAYSKLGKASKLAQEFLKSAGAWGFLPPVLFLGKKK